MVQVIPAILTNSLDEFEKTIRLLEPHTKRVHLDIADGVFVPNETIKGYSELDLVFTNLKFDVHLMVQRPLDHLFSWDKANADRFIVHVESEDVERAIVELRSMSKQVGLAINPDTSEELLDPFIQLVDLVHFMTIEPGFQGREFIDTVVKKIVFFREKHPQKIISVDGGINLTTARSVINAGVDILVSGSFILKSGNVGKAIAELETVVSNSAE